MLVEDHADGRDAIRQPARQHERHTAAVRQAVAVAASTRRPRALDFYRIFVTPDQFDAIRNTDILLAENQIGGACYWTSSRLISEELVRGRSVVADCPVNKVESYQAAFPGRLYRAYVEPPSLEVLRNRQSDGRDPDGRRFAAAADELARVSRGDFDCYIDMRVVNADGNAAGAARVILASWAQRRSRTSQCRR